VNEFDLVRAYPVLTPSPSPSTPLPLQINPRD
jgi:hypothetical protein